MTHEQIRNELHRLIQIERVNTAQLLVAINVAEDERTYAVFGYSSLFKWLVGEYKLSNGAAGRRLQAAKLLRSVPEAGSKISSGALNLSMMCQTQTKITAQEKATDTPITDELKAKITGLVENKTSDEAAEILFESLPEAAPEPTRPQNRKLKNEKTRCPIDLSEDELKILGRAKEILSHQFPDGDSTKVIVYALKRLLKQMDPVEKKPRKKITLKTKAEPTREEVKSQAQIRREVLNANEGGCCFVGTDGHPCNEWALLQTDHIIPLGVGGEDTLENQRPLCRTHNLLMAERVFGKAHMAKFRKRR